MTREETLSRFNDLLDDDEKRVANGGWSYQTAMQVLCSAIDNYISYGEMNIVGAVRASNLMRHAVSFMSSPKDNI